MSGRPLLEVRGLRRYFEQKSGWIARRKRVVRAVDGVDLAVQPGEVLGLVGESGCGKTTLGRCVLRLIEPSAGEITFDGQDLLALDGAALRQARSEMQIVFQDPISSLDPRFAVEESIVEPLRTHTELSRSERRERALTLLEEVGLGEQHLDRYPHELSGGQCQRVALARALILRPRLLVLDEPTSALDVSVQAQIISLLVQLKETYHLTYLFITHDLGVVRYISDRIAVMYLGQMVELGPTRAVFESPLHPYTQALLAAVPIPEPKAREWRFVLEGAAPSPANPPPGCRFHTRCSSARDVCREREPALRQAAPARWVACHLEE
ncbi:MAG: dipeptide/oligopeptide/nickel ABC transporter ATP-binding protein [Chloroflexi bacterium]|nr:MAG: dipeptide/oligopeptide/nickel ABC transporter ATP-binding protein [Chloroflexota bacterium]